ncbi:MAG: site-2 protease family protein, partial [Lentisphaeraceae bacterium]|nr:site-2 protease family protein [Lentisphaeraceae bacterium]
IFNLLPLPVLDGGHIFVATAELISRRKIPAKVLQPVTLIFILFFFSLMIYVTMNDVRRTGDLLEKVHITPQEVQYRT